MAEAAYTRGGAPVTVVTRWLPPEYSISFCAGSFKIPISIFLFQVELRCENAHSTSSHLKEVEQVGDQWNVSKTKQSMKKLTRARHDLGLTLETACLL